MIVSFYVFVVILVLAIPAAFVLIPFTLLTGNVRPLYATGCWIVRFAMRVAGIRVRIEGRERIPAGRACIFMANHVSNLDAPALIANLPSRTSVFLKRPLMKIPILGYAFKLAGFIPVDRTGDSAEAELAVADAQRVLAPACTLPRLLKACARPTAACCHSEGSVYLAKDSGAPCIPVSIYGTEKIIAWGSMRIHPGRRMSSFTHPSIPQTTPHATSFPTPSAPSSHLRFQSECGNRPRLGYPKAHRAENIRALLKYSALMPPECSEVTTVTEHAATLS